MAEICSLKRDVMLIEEAKSIQLKLVRLEQLGLGRALDILSEMCELSTKLIMGSVEGILNGNPDSLRSFLTYRNVEHSQEESEQLFQFLQELSEKFRGDV
ncbi:hypothetical protein ACFL6I_14070 [candidate division KSB1 bacterium]